MGVYKTEPLGRIDLRLLTRRIRKRFELDDALYFPVLEFLEVIMYKAYEKYGFYHEVVGEDVLGNKHADTDIANHCIRIREDVYEGAVNGNGRDRMTIAHEIGHYVLLAVNSLKVSRTFDSNTIKPYEDPEWQAKAFAGELLIAEHLVRGLSAHEIAEGCGVSITAASYQRSKI